MKAIKRILGATALGAAAIMAFSPSAEACSRVVYLGESADSLVMVGRTLDWRTPIPTNLYVYPRGVEKQSMPEGPMLKWRSKYGSVIAVSYDGGVTEVRNEAGLGMNGLFCKGSVYRMSAEGSEPDAPVVSLAMLVSFFLDNFTTTDEAEKWLRGNDFYILGKTFDGGTVSLLHWAITDARGETLLIEYVDGKLSLHSGRDLQVLTNDPSYDKMQAIEWYWKQVGGVNMLPGGVRSPDRFVRASFFIGHVPTKSDFTTAYASLSTIMANVSVPYGYEIEGEPNVSSTQWRSIADLKGGRYYFRFSDSLGDFYIDLGRLRLNPGAPILKLDTTEHAHLFGCANEHLKKSTGFTPMW